MMVVRRHKRRYMRRYPGQARNARRAMLALLCLGLIGLGSGHTARAAAGECKLPADTRSATITLDQQDARAELVVTRPNSAGRKFKVEYNDELFIGKFDAAGRAVVNFALTAPSNELSIRLAELPLITCKIAVPEFGRIFRVVMRWRDPVKMDLDVVEPGRQAGGFGDINRARPNNDLKQGLGQIDLIADPADEGATGELSYVVANGAGILAAGTPTLRAEFVSRGNPPQPPYCGDSARAAVAFELYVIARGEVKRSNFSTARARCGEPLSEAARLMRLRQ